MTDLKRRAEGARRQRYIHNPLLEAYEALRAMRSGRIEAERLRFVLERLQFVHYKLTVVPGVKGKKEAAFRIGQAMGEVGIAATYVVPGAPRGFARRWASDAEESVEIAVAALGIGEWKRAQYKGLGAR